MAEKTPHPPDISSAFQGVVLAPPESQMLVFREGLISRGTTVEGVGTVYLRAHFPRSEIISLRGIGFTFSQGKVEIDYSQRLITKGLLALELVVKRRTTDTKSRIKARIRESESHFLTSTFEPPRYLIAEDIEATSSWNVSGGVEIGGKLHYFTPRSSLSSLRFFFS